MKKTLSFSFIGILMIGCVGNDVPYKKYGDSTGIGFASKVGYSDFSIGNNKYKVTYVGGVYDSPQKVMEFTYKRAKELCKEKEFSDYIITNTSTDRASVSSDSFGMTNYKIQEQKSQSIYSLDVECK